MPETPPDQSMGLPDQSLDRAYRNATYRANGFALRIGIDHPDFDAWLEERGYVTFTILTAHNPRSTPLSDAVNAERHRQLLAEPELATHAHVAASGSDPAGGWPEEIGVCLLNAPAEVGRSLARRYRQHAIVEGQRGGRPVLVWL